MNAYAIPGINRVKTTANYAEKIIDSVCIDWEVPRDKIFEKTRIRRYVIPRHICQYLLREKCKMNYTDIARMFGRDHTSVIHGRKLVKNFLTARYDNPIKSYLNQKTWHF